jgi:tripartite-type tricarboxylate transporter receptor subunit TctC
MFATAGGVLPFIKAGKVRALAVSTPKPTPLFPDLPTIAAAGGLQGYEIRSSNGLLAPAKTPEPIVRRLYQEIAQFMKQPAIQKRFFDEGADALASTPEEFAAVIRSDMTVLGKVIKDAGIREE